MYLNFSIATALEKSIVWGPFMRKQARKNGAALSVAMRRRIVAVGGGSVRQPPGVSTGGVAEELDPFMDRASKSSTKSYESSSPSRDRCSIRRSGIRLMPARLMVPGLAREHGDC